MDTSIICIAYTDGSDGHAIAQLAATKLGFRFVGHEIVVSAARAEGLLPESVAQAEARNVGRTLEVDFGRLERTETVRDLIRAAVGRAADEGKVVIAAHAASYALADREGVVRVLITASEETRAARVAETEEIDAKRAAKRVDESDKARAVYLQRFYSVKRELPTHYDVVVNTDRLGVEAAAAMVVDAAKT